MEEIVIDDETHKPVINEDGTVETEIVKKPVFKLCPVFDVKNTDGEPLDNLEQLDLVDIEKLPLLDIAKSLGITVRKDISDGSYYGYYAPVKNNITLCTDSEQTFFHELAHAIDHKLHGLSLSVKEQANDEIVAEFAGCFLASQYGKTAEMAKTKEYLSYYAGKAGMLKAIDNAFERSFNIVKYIKDFKGE
jgi:antirestriction protein ArdC